MTSPRAKMVTIKLMHSSLHSLNKILVDCIQHTACPVRLPPFTFSALFCPRLGARRSICHVCSEDITRHMLSRQPYHEAQPTLDYDVLQNIFQ